MPDGDKIYLSIVQATQEDLRAGNDDVCPIFGGDRNKDPHPIHACSGFEMGFGILLGTLYGVVERRISAHTATAHHLRSS